MNHRQIGSISWTLVVCSVAGVILYQGVHKQLGIQNRGSSVELETHYAPAENLESIDVATLQNACCSVDMAAYSLTDMKIIRTLTEDGVRGVVVQIYLDNEQTEDAMERPAIAEALNQLATTPHVTVRVKRSKILQHMKSYCVDKAKLRTGSANLSRSGEIEQDNDMLITDDKTAVRNFEANFMRLITRADNYRLLPLQQ